MKSKRVEGDINVPICGLSLGRTVTEQLASIVSKAEIEDVKPLFMELVALFMLPLVAKRLSSPIISPVFLISLSQRCNITRTVKGAVVVPVEFVLVAVVFVLVAVVLVACPKATELKLTPIILRPKIQVPTLKSRLLFRLDLIFLIID